MKHLKNFKIILIALFFASLITSCSKDNQSTLSLEEVVYKQKLKDLLHFTETGDRTDPSKSDFKSYKDAYMFFSALTSQLSSTSQKSVIKVSPVAANNSKIHPLDQVVGPNPYQSPAAPHYTAICSPTCMVTGTYGTGHLAFVFQLDFDAVWQGGYVVYVNEIGKFLTMQYAGPGTVTVVPGANWVHTQSNVGTIGGSSQGTITINGTTYSFWLSYGGGYNIGQMSSPGNTTYISYTLQGTAH